jgi:ABC-2 type transport system ATP-binding protein
MAGLEGRGNRLTGELPLGFKQRLALGCAVLHEPPILVLDEPTSGVDPVARRAFWDQIYTLAAGTRDTQRTTELVSTHYMEEAEYCNRLILMNRGMLIAQGSPAHLRSAMTEPIFELETSDAPAAVAALAQDSAIVDAALFGRAVHVVLHDAEDADRVIPHVLTRHGLEYRGARRVQPSLEDVFVSLVRREGGAVAG